MLDIVFHLNKVECDTLIQNYICNVLVKFIVLGVFDVKKILIIGSQGMLGQSLVKIVERFICIGCNSRTIWC